MGWKFFFPGSSQLLVNRTDLVGLLVVCIGVLLLGSALNKKSDEAGSLRNINAGSSGPDYRMRTARSSSLLFGWLRFESLIARVGEVGGIVNWYIAFSEVLGNSELHGKKRGLRTIAVLHG